MLGAGNECAMCRRMDVVIKKRNRTENREMKSPFTSPGVTGIEQQNVVLLAIIPASARNN